MQITENTWIEYITRLAKINETAGQKMADYIARHGTQDTGGLIAYAQALVRNTARVAQNLPARCTMLWQRHPAQMCRPQYLPNLQITTRPQKW